jgi:hypothetical protein
MVIGSRRKLRLGPSDGSHRIFCRWCSDGTLSSRISAMGETSVLKTLRRPPERFCVLRAGNMPFSGDHAWELTTMLQRSPDPTGKWRLPTAREETVKKWLTVKTRCYTSFSMHQKCAAPLRNHAGWWLGCRSMPGAVVVVAWDLNSRLKMDAWRCRTAASADCRLSKILHGTP